MRRARRLWQREETCSSTKWRMTTASIICLSESFTSAFTGSRSGNSSSLGGGSDIRSDPAPL